MRYILPEDCAGVTYAGSVLSRREDGTIEAEAEAVEALAPHGILPEADRPRPRPRRGADDARLLR